MKIRSKVVLILAGMWAAIFVTVLIFSAYFFSTRMRVLENKAVAIEVARAAQAFQNMEQSLHLLTSNWGLWDDAYDFYLKKSQRFIDGNLLAPAFKNAGLNFIIFFDAKGKFYYGRNYDLKKNQFIPIPESIIDLGKKNAFNRVIRDKVFESGLVSLPQGDLIFSLSPVLKSDGSGESRGALLMGFYITPSHISALSKAVKMPIYFSRLPINADDQLMQQGYVKLINDKTSYAVVLPETQNGYIYGFTGINDYFGRQTAVLGIRVLRTWAQENSSTILWYLTFFVLLGIVILSSVWYLLKIFVLDRITGIMQQLGRISSRSKFNERIQVSGHDELNGMVNEINSMLEIIELSEDQLKSRIANRTSQLEHLSDLNKNLFEEVNRQRTVEENLREHEKFLQKHAYYDELTGLPNRMFFREQAQKLIERAEKNGSVVVIMFLDADKFKSINDTYGHAVGDEFLIWVAGNLRKIIKDSDMIARYAGDEFVVFMNNIRGKTIISHMAEKILREASRPFVRGSINIHSTFSLGISIYPNDGGNISQLEHSADLAMYHAKNQKGNVYCFADSPEESFTLSESSSVE